MRIGKTAIAIVGGISVLFIAANIGDQVTIRDPNGANAVRISPLANRAEPVERGRFARVDIRLHGEFIGSTDGGNALGDAFRGMRS